MTKPLEAYEVANKFGIILYNNTPYFPLSAAYAGYEGDIEFYDIYAQSMLVGFESHWNYNRLTKCGLPYYRETEVEESFSALMPLKTTGRDYDVEKREMVERPAIVGFHPTKLKVAYWQPRGEATAENWKGEPILSAYVYCGKTFGIAAGNLKKAQKRAMIKLMGV